MQNSMIPRDFQAWRHCIEVECGIKLTSEYIQKRITSLENNKEHYTREFLRLYGPEHYQNVLGWFKQAQGVV